MTTVWPVMGCDITSMQTCHGNKSDGQSVVGLLTPPALAYGFDRAATRFSLIVARTGRWVGDACSGSDELTGADVATFPGGGEPSAVKCDFCSASVLATGTGVTAGLFMPMTFTLRRSAICRVARERRLSLSAHGFGHGDHDRLSSRRWMPGLLTCASPRRSPWIDEPGHPGTPHDQDP